MILRASLSQQGIGRTENRDASGSAHNAGAYLYAITDGSSRSGSGELAQALTDHMLECFSQAAPPVVCSPDKALKLALAALEEAHSNLCPDFPFASTSYLALLVVGCTTITIHAGDCCLGYLGKEQRMVWLTPPHCGPNWQGDLSHAFIARSPHRKQLLNCMSRRRPHEPAVQFIKTGPDTTWVLATDGFWAELSAEHQLKAISTQTLEGCPTKDDATFMVVQT